MAFIFERPRQAPMDAFVLKKILSNLVHIVPGAFILLVSEGVRLWQTQPQTHLMLSGAKFLSDISQAETMINMALALGVT